MVSFSSIDIIVIVAFLAVVIAVGFYSGKITSNDADDYLLSGRKLGLLLFVLTNVSAWYGGKKFVKVDDVAVLALVKTGILNRKIKMHFAGESK